jgi:hypothetical protein
MDFKSSKYDPNTDPHYPKVGDVIDSERVVSKVKHIEASDLYKLLTAKEQPEDVEHIMIVDNPERPYLKYLVWWKYTEE